MQELKKWEISKKIDKDEIVIITPQNMMDYHYASMNQIKRMHIQGAMENMDKNRTHIMKK